jgi:hypothetical protein
MAKVFIIESESGWGQRVDEVKEFASMAEARRYAAGYNAKFNPPLKPGEPTPEWYMYARVEGDDGYGILRG